MAIQTATISSGVEAAQRIVIAQCLFTNEHNAPCANLVDKFTLGQGEKQLTLPKAGQADAHDLVDGVDLVQSENMGLTYNTATPNEVGLKFILTKKLIRQFNEDVFRVVGRQIGDAMARKRDEDVIALFSGLDGALGGSSEYLTKNLAMGCVSYATAHKFGSPVFVVHHPNALSWLTRSLIAFDLTYYSGIMPGFSEALMRNFWGCRMNNVNFFQDGNVALISGSTTDAYGAIANKSAMAVVESQAPETEREYDASLRAWEVVMVSDYVAVEVDGAIGASMRYQIGDLATTS